MPAPFRASDHAADNKLHLLIACTGSVATIKLPQILSALQPHAPLLSVRLILTASATAFLAGQSPEQPLFTTLPTLHPVLASIHLDADEWSPPWTRSAPILHIELRRWADALLVAPLSATSLSRLATGRADDLVSAVARAWDTRAAIDPVNPAVRTTAGQKPIWVAPAMNSAMWAHPVTAAQLGVLEGEWGEAGGGWFRVLRPVEKVLACADVGAGAMMEWGDIVREVLRGLGLAGTT